MLGRSETSPSCSLHFFKREASVSVCWHNAARNLQIQLAAVVDDSNFNSSGTDIDSKTIALIHADGEVSPYLLCDIQKPAQILFAERRQIFVRNYLSIPDYNITFFETQLISRG